MYRPLRDQRILLTGASSGIGWHLALQLAASGARVVATARRESRLIELASKSNSNSKTKSAIHYLAGDLTSDPFRQQLIQYTVEQLGGLDILINNAGAGAIGRFCDASPTRLRSIMEIDFFAPVELTRLAVPHLQKGNRPAIMLIGSVLGHRAVPGKSEYCAAKFALRGWGEALRCELHPVGIDVIMLSPSTTQSEFFDNLHDSSSKLKNKSLGSTPPATVAKIAKRALQRNSRDVILSAGGKSLVWASRFCPRILDRILWTYGQPDDPR
jgi:short-subunit dehydrogenase